MAGLDEAEGPCGRNTIWSMEIDMITGPGPAPSVAIGEAL